MVEYLWEVPKNELSDSPWRVKIVKETKNLFYLDRIVDKTIKKEDGARYTGSNAYCFYFFNEKSAQDYIECRRIEIKKQQDKVAKERELLRNYSQALKAEKRKVLQRLGLKIETHWGTMTYEMYHNPYKKILEFSEYLRKMNDLINEVLDEDEHTKANCSLLEE